MESLNITKVKNFEGYWFNCAECGSDIKHAYRVDNSKHVYGSEYVYKVAGIKRSEVKKIDSRMKQLNKMLNNKEVYSWDSYKEALGMTDDELCDKFMETGSLG